MGQAKKHEKSRPIGAKSSSSHPAMRQPHLKYILFLFNLFISVGVAITHSLWPLP
jgi:hypothetical protein